MITRQKYQDYINVLKEELIPAMGCNRRRDSIHR